MPGIDDAESSVEVRPAEDADLPSILEIYNDAVLNTTAVYDYNVHTLQQRRQWFDARRQAGYPILVAALGGTIVGYSSLGPFRPFEAYKYTAENSVYISPSSRNKGIGRLLLEPLIELARQMGLHAIVAGIDADNDISIRLHRKLGFVEVAYFRQVGFKFGRWLDLRFMELLLPDSSSPG